MNHKKFIARLRKVDACSEAIEFIEKHNYSMQEAWDNCERADWMLWLMVRFRFATQRERIHIICDCAATALKYVPKGEDRPRLAIEATRRYADNPTEKNRAARAAAWAAAWAAAGYAARAAAWAAARTTARAAAWAAAGYAAGDAARAAARAAAGDAASAVTGDAAGTTAHKKMCKIIREKIRIK